MSVKYLSRLSNEELIDIFAPIVLIPEDTLLRHKIKRGKDSYEITLVIDTIIEEEPGITGKIKLADHYEINDYDIIIFDYATDTSKITKAWREILYERFGPKYAYDHLIYHINE